MPNKILKFELVEGLPEDNGTYFLLLEDGSIKEGYLGSFSFPYHQESFVREHPVLEDLPFMGKCKGKKPCAIADNEPRETRTDQSLLTRIVNTAV